MIFVRKFQNFRYHCNRVWHKFSHAVKSADPANPLFGARILTISYTNWVMADFVSKWCQLVAMATRVGLTEIWIIPFDYSQNTVKQFWFPSINTTVYMYVKLNTYLFGRSKPAWKLSLQALNAPYNFKFQFNTWLFADLAEEKVTVYAAEHATQHCRHCENSCHCTHTTVCLALRNGKQDFSTCNDESTLGRKWPRWPTWPMVHALKC